MAAGALLIVAATLVAYGPALEGGFVWDDDDYVADNATLRDVTGLKHIWFELGATPQYYPLVFTSFWLEYQLWELNTFGYHVVNVLLHTVSALLLWRVLSALEVPGAWLAAAMFALHPVHVESVAWITERKNVLSGVFYLGSLIAYLRFELPQGGANLGARENVGSMTRPTSWGWYALALVLFVCALLSKSVTCSLPVVILLVLWWKGGLPPWRRAVSLIPMFAIGVAMGLVTIWMEKHNVGARGPEWDLTLAERFIIAGRAVWFYVAKLAWPAPLIFVYPKWELDAGELLEYVYPLSVAAVLVVLWAARGKIGRGPIVAALFFVGTLLPALGFINTYPMRYYFVADHFQYLASIGPIAVFAAMIGGRRAHRAATSETLARHRGRRECVSRANAGSVGGIALARYTAAGLFVCVLAMLTWAQAKVYGDVETLYRDTLAKNPRAAMAHNNLGLVRANEGRLVEAVRHFREAVRVDPDFFEAQYNLGTRLSMQGKTDEAVFALFEALRISPQNEKVLNNLGNTYLKRGETERAAESYRALLRVNPNHADGRANLGVALVRMGRFEEALGEYRAAIVADVNHIGAHHNLALALAGLGMHDEAIAEFREALKLNSELGDVFFGLGRSLAAVGRPGEAAGAYREALRLNPRDSEARRALEDLRRD